MVALMNEISESDIERYNNDGAVALRGVFDEAWLERIALAIQDDIRDPGPFYHGYASNESLHSDQLQDGDPLDCDQYPLVIPA